MKVGQIFKSQKELCEYIGVEYKDSTNSRKAQLKEFDMRFKWHKEGRKIIIDEIFKELREKVDNRKGNSGKSIGSRENNNIYGKYVDKILAYEFLYRKAANNDVIYTTTNLLAEICGIINHNYRTVNNNKYEFFQYLAKINSNISKTAMYDVFHIIKNSSKSIISSSLKRLTKEGYINFKETYLIYFDNKVRFPMVYETEILKDIEKKTLELMSIEKKNILQYNDQLRNKYYEKFIELAKEEIENLDSVFVEYKIYIFLEKYKVKDILLDIKLLNKIVMEKTKEKLRRIYEKNELEYDCSCGYLNPFLPKFVIDRLDIDYLKYTDLVIDFLISLNAEYIAVELKKESMNKNVNKRTSSLIEDIKLPY